MECEHSGRQTLLLQVRCLRSARCQALLFLGGLFTVTYEGKVGIGTTAPGAKLDIKGATGTNSTYGIITRDTSGNENFFVADGGRVGLTYYPFTIGIPSSTAVSGGTVKFQIEEAGLFTVRTDGNVGIGTTTPTTPFNVRVSANNEFNVWEVGNRTKMSVGIGYNATNRLEISYDYTNLENAYISRFYSTATLHFDMNGTDHMVIDSTGNVGIGSSSPAAPLDVARASDYKVTKIGGDVTSHYVLTGNADHTLTLTSPSYFQAEIVITANQTNGGTYNNFYMRGIWSNNHTSHHWDEIENIGSLTGSTFTITVGQNGGTTNSGEWKIVHDDVSGSFDGMTVRITDLYGTHAYTIS